MQPMKDAYDVPVETASARLEAFGHAWADAHAGAAEPVLLGQAHGRVLAQDVRARDAHPNVDDAALDGIACRVADTRDASEASPATLRLIGTSHAGRPFDGRLSAGEAIRIMTGAAVPEGADGIVPVETLREEGEVVKVFAPARAEAIRAAGQDLEAGAVGLPAGRRIDAAALGLAATMGHDTVQVRPTPRVAILPTGDELVTPGGTLAPGEVYDGNGPALEALARVAGARPTLLPRVGDRGGALEEAVDAALTGANPPDLFISCGGISAGRADLVRDLLEREGELVFRRVRLKPGGPATFAHLRDVAWLALPGNPVSALVTFVVLARAWIDRASGREGPLPFHTRIPADAGEPLAAAGGKTTLARVTLAREAGRLTARSAGPQNSGVLRTLTQANALAILPPHARLEVGDPVDVVPLAPHFG